MARSIIFYVLLPILITAEALAEPHVGVFMEKGFPVAGGTPSLPPPKIVEVLKRQGISAQALSAKDLSDPTILNPQRFAVLVMPYGNAFPKSAFLNLQKFHQSGGCLVLNGIPFCHPCVETNGQWQDLGHVSYFGPDSNGIDTGRFGGPMPRSKNPRVSIPGHPLFLQESMLPKHEGNLQWLDPHSLASGDQVIPLVNIGVGNEQHPAAALIRHLGADCHGARDVWMGQVADGSDESARYLAEQLLIRGILWCELEKGELSQTAFRAGLAKADQIQKPEPLPGNLSYVVTPRPWGNTYLPKSKPPTRQLLVVNARHLNTDDRIALTCLQGLTSREQPCIWLVRGREDQQWLDWHKAKGYIGGYTMVTNWPDLFKKFSGQVKGAIIPDPELYRGKLLAVDVAECEDWIVTTPELAKKLGLTAKMDLRGRFQTYVEGMRWVWKHYRNRLSRHLCRFMAPSLMGDCTFAYDYEWRSVMFWVTGPVDEAKLGADRFAERQLMAKIFSEMDPNIAVLGYPYAGEGIGMGEGDGVAFASRYAKGLVCSDFLANACVMSGVRVGKMTQPRQPPPPPLNKNDIYIAMVMSDGDNENTWISFFKQYFNDPDFGKYPLAFGMGPAIYDLMSGVAEWYYEHASPQTEFIADVSGVAYIQPENYGLAYADRDRVFDDFLKWTAQTMSDMGMRSVRTVEGNDDLLARYAKALPFYHSLFADMGRYSGRNGIENLTYSLPDGMPVFRAVTSWRYGKNGFLREIREQVGNHRPAFVNGFVHCWTFGPEDLDRIYKERDPDMVFVTPAQLAMLYREARAKGWAK